MVLISFLNKNVLVTPLKDSNISLVLGTYLSFIFCKNELEEKEKLKRIILPIQFYSNELNFTFEITYDDILKEDGEYFFIKMLFHEWGRSWTFGMAFSLKYKLVFNPDIKQIGFCPKYKTKKGLDINWKNVI